MSSRLLFTKSSILKILLILKILSNLSVCNLIEQRLQLRAAFGK